jgi:signal transduction histidine kinase
VKSRRRLFRKYVVVIVGLVTVALLASGLVELYFSSRETEQALVALQREKAAGAAARIEAFVREIEQQMGWVIQPQLGPEGPGAVEQRRLDYLRLQKQVHAITELQYLDDSGREQLRVSRLAMDIVASGTDFSTDPRFLEPKSGRTFYGPVYFRKESEPYMTLALAGVGRRAGVTVAEVNLKFIWDVVSQIRIGKAGLAYVVDRGGALIAHPDISLVLQKTDLSGLPQVRAALAAAAPGRPADPVTTARDARGQPILTASAPVAPVGWSIIVEQPKEEAFEPLRDSIERTVGLIALGVAFAVVASLVLARRMVTPIQALQEGATRIGAGELGHRLDVRTGDELETLAEQFNTMTAQLQESHATLERRVEERTRELTEALEQQTATGEILRVISRSPTDVQPVFEAIAEHAARLCDAAYCAVVRFDGGLLHLAAHRNYTPDALALVARLFPRPPGRDNLGARSVFERRTIHVPDVEADPDVPASSLAVARTLGYRAFLAVPMLRDGVPLGFIALNRTAGGFPDDHIRVVQTFADQAVIAIENVRLFQELQARTAELARSVQELRALGEVGQAISSTLDLARVLETVVQHASTLSRADGGAIYEYEEASAEFRLRATLGFPADVTAMLRQNPLRLGEGAVGRAGQARTPVQIPDVEVADAYHGPLRDVMRETRFRAVLAVPLLREDRIVGGLVVARREAGEFSPEMVTLLQTFATQSTLAIQNARLFQEIEDKGRQLEVANRHKSEFLANMSHELRTPLNAVIGFSEVLLERMFGELNDKQAEYLADILSSGRHLLSLINDILDLSKVEAGRMDLELDTFSLPAALEGALTLIRERAARHGVGLVLELDDAVGDVVADERKVKQVLLNLLSNAVKFTPDGGRITVRALAANGDVEVSVADTGIGIAAEDQEAIFEEFRQVGDDYARKREGTGLGLALARRFVALHGGRLWVKSAPGEGSTFTFTLPRRPPAAS